MAGGSVNGVAVLAAQYAQQTFGGSDIGGGGFIIDPGAYGVQPPPGAYTTGLTNNGIILKTAGTEASFNRLGPGNYLLFTPTGSTYTTYTSHYGLKAVYIHNHSPGGLALLVNNGSIVGSSELIGDQVSIVNSGYIDGGIFTQGGTAQNSVVVQNSGIMKGYGYVIEGGDLDITNTGLMTVTETAASNGSAVTTLGIVHNQGTIVSPNTEALSAGALINSKLVAGAGDYAVAAPIVTNLAGGTIAGTGTAGAINAFSNTTTSTVVNAGLVTAAGNGIILDGGSVNNLATGTILAAGSIAVDGGYDPFLKNAGMIAAAGTIHGPGHYSGAVQFLDGGTIINQAGATISAQNGSAISLNGYYDSTYKLGVTGTLQNFGTIETSTTGTSGVDLFGHVVASNASSGIITGAAYGLRVQGDNASLTNAGTIGALIGLPSSNQSVGVAFGTSAAGGSLINTATGSISGGSGVAFGAAGLSLVNAGTINGRGRGEAAVTLAVGGSVRNQASAFIGGNYVFKSYGVAASGGAGTITNSGTIFGRTKGVYLGAGGSLTNAGSIGVFVGSVGGYAAVQFAGTYASSVFNAGTIGSTAAATLAYGITSANGLYVDNRLQGIIAGSSGVSVKQGVATVTNAGTIQGNGTLTTPVQGGGTVGALGSIGVYAGGGLTLANAASGTIAGGNGVFIRNGSGAITNAGLIESNAYNAIALVGTSSSFYLNNTATGTIVSDSGGPLSTQIGIRAIEVYASSTIINSGTIDGLVGFNGSASFTNKAGGYSGGVQNLGTQATNVINSGTLLGVRAFNGDLALQNTTSAYLFSVGGVNGTIENAGTIAKGIEFGLQVRSSSVYITNASTGVILSDIKGQNQAIVVNQSSSSALTIKNSGTIMGGDAIGSDGPGLIENAAGALISGRVFGTGSQTLVNAGTITADGTSGGVLSDVVINQAGGQILAPVGFASDGRTAGGARTIVNAGVIGNAANPGVAIALLANGGTHRLVVQPGAQFYGSVNGSTQFPGMQPGTSASTIEFAPGAGRLAGFGAQITNFNSVVFDAGSAWTAEGTGAGLGVPVVSGFSGRDMIDIDGFVSQDSSFSNGALNLTSASGGHVSLDLVGNFTAASFLIGGDGAGGTNIALACFAAGTRIATPAGPVPIELLREGDQIDVLGETPQPVVWIGTRTIDFDRHPLPKSVWPVRIMAGALGQGLPRRDLFVSPEHALFIDGGLIPAGLLANGGSIASRPTGRITYYHIELPRHSIVFAEGLPCESWLDAGNRAMFENAVVASLHFNEGPCAADAWATNACAPLITSGPLLAAAQQRLGAPWLLDARIDTSGRHAIAVAAEAAGVRLLSKPGRAPGDARWLGAAITRVWLDTAMVPLDDVRFGNGFHPAELGWRWTDGAAVLRLGSADVERALLIEVTAVAQPETAAA